MGTGESWGRVTIAKPTTIDGGLVEAGPAVPVGLPPAGSSTIRLFPPGVYCGTMGESGQSLVQLGGRIDFPDPIFSGRFWLVSPDTTFVLSTPQYIRITSPGAGVGNYQLLWRPYLGGRAVGVPVEQEVGAGLVAISGFAGPTDLWQLAGPGGAPTALLYSCVGPLPRPGVTVPALQAYKVTQLALV